MQSDSRQLVHSTGLLKTISVAGCLFVAILVHGLAGCGRLAYRLDNSVPETFVPNPLELPPADDDFVWSQVVDSVDDYFRISREQPVQNSGGIILDGRVETSYRIGASVFEPCAKIPPLDSNGCKAPCNRFAAAPSSQCAPESPAISLKWSCRRISRIPTAANTQPNQPRNST